MKRLVKSPGFQALASLKLTLALLVVLAVAVLNAYRSADELFRASQYGFWLTLPLGLLCLNLVAAILARPAFRAQPGLLLFHLSLLAVVVLAGWGQLTNLKATAEVSSGGWFAGQLNNIQAGPLHGEAFKEVRFHNLGFEIRYAPGPVRRHTYNEVQWTTADGQERREVVGDQVPLVIQGYRFYTSFNKGFAPRFLWRLNTGAVHQGNVHLPAWPANEFSQSSEWVLPQTEQKIWVQLQFDEEILSRTEPSVFRPPRDYQLVVRDGDRRQVLEPGMALNFPQGTLVFQGLDTWMGYSVYYDQARYWMLAACLLAVLSLSWHFWSRFSQRPWNRPLVRGESS